MIDIACDILSINKGNKHINNCRVTASLHATYMYYAGFVLYHVYSRKWQDYVYIQCEYKSTKQKIKHLLREENKVKGNKIS